jgi:chromosome segregation ATPase
LETAREQPAQLADSNTLIAGLASGSLDVLELDRPQAEARQRIEALEAQVDAWTRARDVAEKSIPVRETALGIARMKADAAARELVRAEAPIAALLGERPDLVRHLTFVHEPRKLPISLGGIFLHWQARLRGAPKGLT